MTGRVMERSHAQADSVGGRVPSGGVQQKGLFGPSASPGIRLRVQHRLVPASPRHGSNAPWRPRHAPFMGGEGKVVEVDETYFGKIEEAERAEPRKMAVLFRITVEQGTTG